MADASNQSASGQPASAPREFFRALETLRGLAACGVVAYHARWTFHGSQTFPKLNGWVLVDFFFVLSGFVLAHNYATRLRTRGDLQRFFLLRLARLYPLHFLLLQLWLGYEALKWIAANQFGLSGAGAPFERNGAIAYLTNLTLTHSLNLNSGTTFNVPSWSISVEFATYGVFALLVALLHRRRALTSLAALSLSAAGLALLLRCSEPRALAATFDYGFFRCLYGFFAGVVVRQIWSAQPRSRDTPYGVASTAEIAGLGALALALAVSVEGWWGSYLAIPLFCCVVYVFAEGRGLLGELFSRPSLMYLGTISYSIYMSHTIVTVGIDVTLRVLKRHVVDNEIRISPWVGDGLLVATFVLTLGLSHLLYRWVEDPWRRRGRRWVEDRFAA